MPSPALSKAHCPTHMDQQSLRWPLPTALWWRTWVPGIGLMMVIIAVAAGAIVTTLGAVSTGEASLDAALAAHRTPAITLLAWAVDIGVGPKGAPVILAVICIGLFTAHRRNDAFALGAMTSIGWTGAALPKLIVRRHRPGAELQPLKAELGHDSFPSGHTAFIGALAMAAVVLLIRARMRRAATVMAVLGVAAIAFVSSMRMYLGVHFLVDVTAAPLFSSGVILILLPQFMWFSNWATERTSQLFRSRSTHARRAHRSRRR
ncbi:phosphatase PAP2 family protein [Devriesea agamarum]|uniref:phosphatase PAP2 family protein n=1 Tax=Devriesea agamarum TaxID=472569 RepID=UPI00071D8EDB|nr:phosphatase PAP2 family protein [Devriesea agamarum]